MHGALSLLAEFECNHIAVHPAIVKFKKLWNYAGAKWSIRPWKISQNWYFIPNLLNVSVTRHLKYKCLPADVQLMYDE